MNAHIEKQEKTDLNLNMSLDDMNKQVVSQLSDLDQNGIIEAKTLISEYAIGNYFMLLCRDINYYTLFAIQNAESNEPKFADEVIACAEEIGVIKSVTLTEDKGAIEIWVSYKDSSIVMYLFNYDEGVVQCQK